MRITPSAPTSAELAGGVPFRSGWIAAAACAALLGLAALAGAQAIHGYSRVGTDRFTGGVKQASCLERQLGELLPAGSRVWVDRADKPMVRPLEEMTVPRFTLMARPEPGAYRLRAVAATGPRQPGDCPSRRLSVQMIP